MRTVFEWGDLTERVHLEDLGVDGRKIVKRIFRKWEGVVDWINLAQVRVEKASAFECSNELMETIRCMEFLV